ncbi:MAG: hypothetical protein M1321_01955 [Candidatus Marsarchaeota archaeon]|nr:hypothetical protein [Candidatus Marsarchaeota archaeon]
MKKRDSVVWLVIVIVAAAAVTALYIETRTSNGSIDVSLGLVGSRVQHIYPYQQLTFEFTVSNRGNQAFRDLGIGVFINGNLTEAYNVTMPQHNSTAINFTDEFKTPGVFNVSFIADPSGLLLVSNRSAASVSSKVVVQPAGAPDPASDLPANQLSEQDSHMDSAGYLTSAYLKSEYGIKSLALTGIAPVDAFFGRMFNLTYNYTNAIYSADAGYANASAYSLWIQGSFIGNITAVWAKGLEARNKNVSIAFSSFNGSSMSVITLAKNITVCSWYSQGWIKNLAYEGNESCSAVLTGRGRSIAGNSIIPELNYSEDYAEFSGASGAGSYYGRIARVGNTIIYESIRPGLDQSHTCYGPISSLGNRSYCSTYLFSKSANSIGKFSLIRTTAFVGQRNISVMALVNTSLVTQQAADNIAILQGFNLSGNSQAFTSGVNSTCSFNASISCSSPSLTRGSLGFVLRNNMNGSVRISSMSCEEGGAARYSIINASIPALSSYNATVPCYDNGAVITGVPLGLTLKLGMNYTVSGKGYRAAGSAFIV